MKQLDRYLGRQILWFTLLVMALLVCLAALFLFIQEQDGIGTGSFGMLDAVFMTLLRLPAQAFQLLPIGALIGAWNGTLVAVFRLPAIVVTLATNGVLQTVALVYCNGTPSGFAPPALRWFMNREQFGVKPVVWFLAVFIVVALLALTRSTFGRRLFAVGSNRRAAYLSGVNVDATLVAAYVMSGVCAAAVGLLLAGFDGQATLGMGDGYLLPSIAVVVVGGTLVTGGRGHFLSMVLGVLFLVALQILLAGSDLPSASRSIAFGAAIIAAVVALRERRTS